MMKGLVLLALALVAVSEPANATGGFQCRTAGDRPIELSLGFGHVPGSPLFLARLLDNRRPVPVKSAQWWFDKDDLRLVLIDPGGMRREVVLRARRNGHVYDGSLWRGGRRRWVRCREG